MKCETCGGSGSVLSGVEYMGQSESIGCEDCWGTGLSEPWDGIERLRIENERLRKTVGAIRAIKDLLAGSEDDATYDIYRELCDLDLRQEVLIEELDK